MSRSHSTNSTIQQVASADSSLLKQALSGIVWVYSSTALTAIVGIVTLAALARVLTPSDFGLVASAFVVFKLAQAFISLAIGPALIQYAELRSEHIRTGFTINIAIGACAACLMWAAAPYCAAFFREEQLTTILPTLAIALFAYSCSTVAEFLMRRNLNLRAVAAADVVSQIVGQTLVAIVLGWYGFGAWSLVIGQLVQTLIRSTMLVYYHPHDIRPQFNKNAARDLAYFGSGFTLTRILNYFATEGDNMVVGRCLGGEALGIYSRAYQLAASSLIIFTQVTDKVLFPAMSRMQDDPKRMAAAFRSGLTAVAFITMPASAFLFLLAPEIVHVLMGSEWEAVVVPLQILTVGMFFRTSYKVHGSIARAAGAVYRYAMWQGVYAITVLAGAYAGQFYGLTGVAFAVTLSVAIHCLCMAHMGIGLAGISARDMLLAHVPGTILTGIVSAELLITAVFLRSFAVPSLLILALSGVLTALTGLALCWIAPGKMLGYDGAKLFMTVTKRLGPERPIVLRFHARLQRAVASNEYVPSNKAA